MALWIKYFNGNEVSVDGSGEITSAMTHVDGYVYTDICEVSVTASSIGDSAFLNAYGLSSITMSNVTGICKNAFDGCLNLTGISLSNVTSIGSCAFRCCHSLSSITLGNGVSVLNEMVFSHCLNLRSVILPRNLSIISGSVFADCESLERLDLPSSLTKIGYGAFKGCSMLSGIHISRSVPPELVVGGVSGNDSGATFSDTNNCKIYVSSSDLVNTYKVAWRDSVLPHRICTEDGSQPDVGGNVKFYALYENGYDYIIEWDGSTMLRRSDITGGMFDYGAIVSAEVGDCVTSIGNDVFNGCSSLTSVTISNSVTSIGNGAFSGCENLVNISLPNGITRIGKDLFNGCSSLSDITIPSSVSVIGDSAFFNCDDLLTITIPSNVTSIGSYALTNCYSLRSVVINCVNPPVLGADVFNSLGSSSRIYVPCDSVSEYRNANGWNEYADKIYGIEPCDDTPDDCCASIVLYDGEDPDEPVVDCCDNIVLYEGSDEVQPPQPVKYSITIISSGNGDVRYNGTTIRNRSDRFDNIDEGTYVRLEFSMDESTLVDVLSVNCIDVTDDISNNAYEVGSLNGNKEISVEFITSSSPADIPEPEEPGVQWVDMGTSVLWADRNIGANVIGEYGKYIGWGDPTGENDSTNPYDYARYFTGDSIAGTSFDTATNLLGGGARMPHFSEFVELFGNVSMERVTVNGYSGYLLTSRTTGNHIFFPASGYYSRGVGDRVGSYIYMWSADIDPNGTNPILVRWTASGPVSKPNSKILHSPLRAVKGR